MIEQPESQRDHLFEKRMFNESKINAEELLKKSSFFDKSSKLFPWLNYTSTGAITNSNKKSKHLSSAGRSKQASKGKVPKTTAQSTDMRKFRDWS